MSLKEIFCQDRAVDVLQRAFATGQVPHAYIFAGPEGVGRFKTAGEWAKLLLCKEPVVEKGESGFADSCGACESCRFFEANSHPDFNSVYKELIEFTQNGKGKKTPVDLPKAVIQEFLIDRVSSKPTVSERKVFVVSEAEKLNITSQNSLLKVLEEPPEYCCIILLCSRLERLLPTTKSRCQIIRFEFIDEDRISERLKEMGVEEAAGQYFARFCGGSIGIACQWGRLEAEGADFYNTKKDLIEAIARCQYSGALKTAQKFLDESKRIKAVWTKLDSTISQSDIGRRVTKGLIQIVVSALGDAMKFGLRRVKEQVNLDQQGQIEKLAGRFGPEQSAEKIVKCYELMRWVESAVNERLIFERLLLNLAVSDTMAA